MAASSSNQKHTPHGRWEEGPRSVDPRLPAGLPFPVPEILEFVALRDSGKDSGTPEQTPETATAFSSVLR